ncbi:AAA family ATPase [Escherichia coli]|uniref:AAA family ATPase n=1 Tax=Escherichia coli TaxID=562 RepID=UPI000DA56832|nr:AAA family ATPase [Escherichia coli]SQS25414.1 Predicted ATP-binding protein involved in virulence [Escherichia coli]SQS38367.1 Predicted ATP-binding protein involved in virulence [Escherichia coli]SQW16206.1 Predicted ATP-binding protein involved in virulence [Escherichia coli]SQW39330.1 Predicted ATP-binding protein involved in virulence [Escherichia coli]SQW68896.1 Predicted ATP-binding protein involved in virulence [Escherichia coli]
MSQKITKLKEIKIKSFRGLNDCTIHFGERITAICGKNGTSKSTVLGIAAQMFNFETDYTQEPKVDLRKYKTLAGKPFSSQFREHFRLSEKFDTPSSMDVDVIIYDGAEQKELEQLKLGLYLRSEHSYPRATVRNNTTTNGASDSRKVTHPLIYLSMKRLTPVPDRQKYTVSDIDEFMNLNRQDFVQLSSYILGVRNANNLTKTNGTIDSMVVSGEKYDHQSVSVGEDNLGQILQAIFSFKKLQAEYPDYHGGILLIDEIDAGLFPAAQRRLIEKLSSITKKLDLQVVFTTHSPEIINSVYEYTKRDSKNYKVIYLTNTYGKLEVKNDYSWGDIRLDLCNETLQLNKQESIRKTNVFFEDKENYDLFCSVVTRRDIRRLLNLNKDITLGCKNYIQLLNKKVPSFYKSAIIVLDADVENVKHANVVKLPGILPPDQIIFEYLFNLDASDDFWKNNPLHYTKDYFFEKSNPIITALNISEQKIKLKEKIKEVNKDKLDGSRIRELFKKFIQEKTLQELIKCGGVKYNPYRKWAEDNKILVDKFNDTLIEALRFVIGEEFGLNPERVKSVVTK